MGGGSHVNAVVVNEEVADDDEAELRKEVELDAGALFVLKSKGNNNSSIFINQSSSITIN